MLIKDAKKLYLGGTQATAVYAGSTKVWPQFSPADLSGLAVWHDAADYTSGSWPNKAVGGDQPAFVGTPHPQISPVAKNGRPLVRFTANEGRLRGTCSMTRDYTLVYATQFWGTNVGRSFATVYPGTNTCNVVGGFHSSSIDWCYENGNVNTPSGWQNDIHGWRLYSIDSRLTPTPVVRFFISGVQSGVDWPDGHGLGGRYNLSGYDLTGAQETMDCEVAELVLYNRRLSDTDRQKVEGYLRVKWALT